MPSENEDFSDEQTEMALRSAEKEAVGFGVVFTRLKQFIVLRFSALTFRLRSLSAKMRSRLRLLEWIVGR